MRHELSVTGAAFALRPVELSDAAFIVALRAGTQRSRFLHPVAPDVAGQEAYLRRYFERPGDYYFIIEHRASGRSEGTVGIYDVDAGTRAAEWGRWIITEGSAAALESAVLAYRVAFEMLDLDMVYCRTVADNLPVVSFHESFGLERHAILPGQFRLGDAVYDAVEHRLSRARWGALKPGHEAKAARLAAMMARRPAAPR